MRHAPSEQRAVAAEPALVALVYELLDAHADTAELAAELVDHPRWGAQLDYLRALQRTARATLAHTTTGAVR
jgi:hypothetical protein